MDQFNSSGRQTSYIDDFHPDLVMAMTLDRYPRPYTDSVLTAFGVKKILFFTTTHAFDTTNTSLTRICLTITPVDVPEEYRERWRACETSHHTAIGARVAATAGIPRSVGRGNTSLLCNHQGWKIRLASSDRARPNGWFLRFCLDSGPSRLDPWMRNCLSLSVIWGFI